MTTSDETRAAVMAAASVYAHFRRDSAAVRQRAFAAIATAIAAHEEQIARDTKKAMLCYHDWGCCDHLLCGRDDRCPTCTARKEDAG